MTTPFPSKWGIVVLLQYLTGSAYIDKVQLHKLEEVQHFKYLGSYISADSNIEKEVSTRIGLAAQAFNRLQNIWKSSTLTTRTKLKIYTGQTSGQFCCMEQKHGESIRR